MDIKTMDNKKIFLPLAIVLAVTLIGSGVIAYVAKGTVGGAVDGVYDELAQCITASGAVFYGAFWCPHCQNQKEAFGSASEYLSYVECSPPSGQGQTDVCRDAGIQSYPTWVFGDGARVSGEVRLSSLAELTNCTMPTVEESTG